MNITFANKEERRHTGNIKWDRQGHLPFGIADMDIQSPPCVVEAMQKRLDHHFYGYAFMTDELRGTIVKYLQEQHGVTAQPEWLHDLPGCVPAFTLVARAICTQPTDEIMVCTPAYPPMLHCHEDVGCQLNTVACVQHDGVWQMDWDAMEASVTPNTRLFLHCNPHNPLGRSWSAEEMDKLADFCERHDLILCSDEIHCDLVLQEDLRHHSVLEQPEKILQRSIMLSAPSKTFNIAGICFTFMVIPNEELRNRIRKAQGHTLPTLNVFAYAATQAAYTEGWEWQAELKRVLRSNRDFAYAYIAEHMPMLRTYPHEATYLAWIDCSALGQPSAHEFFLEHGDIYLDNGANFGDAQSVRLNFACSPEMLKCGLEAMRKAVETLQNNTTGK